MRRSTTSGVTYFDEVHYFRKIWQDVFLSSISYSRKREQEKEQWEVKISQQTQRTRKYCTCCSYSTDSKLLCLVFLQRNNIKLLFVHLLVSFLVSMDESFYNNLLKRTTAQEEVCPSMQEGMAEYLDLTPNRHVLTEGIKRTKVSHDSNPALYIPSAVLEIFILGLVLVLVLIFSPLVFVSFFAPTKMYSARLTVG